MPSQAYAHCKRPPGSNEQRQTHSHTGDAGEWISKNKVKLVRKQRTGVSRVLSYKRDIYITHPSRELGDPQGSGGRKS